MMDIVFTLVLRQEVFYFLICQKGGYSIIMPKFKYILCRQFHGN